MTVHVAIYQYSFLPSHSSAQHCAVQYQHGAMYQCSLIPPFSLINSTAWCSYTVHEFMLLFIPPLNSHSSAVQLQCSTTACMSLCCHVPVFIPPFSLISSTAWCSYSAVPLHEFMLPCTRVHSSLLTHQQHCMV